MHSLQHSSIGDKLGITQFIVYCILLIMSVTATYATLTFRVNVVEEKAAKYQSDHEYILVLNSKIDRLLEDLKEVKVDMKEIKGRR